MISAQSVGLKTTPRIWTSICQASTGVQGSVWVKSTLHSFPIAERDDNLTNTVSLAFCEMYTLLANLFRRFELEIYNTTDDDMKWIDLLLT
jgi:hypothetical protein